MTNPYYDHTTYPNPNAPGASAALRAELNLIEAGFDKLPTLAGNANKLVVVNGTNDGLIAVSVLPNLSVIDSTFLVQDNGDATKQFRFEASGITAGATRVVTVPDVNLTLVGLDTIQTLTNKTLTAPTINTGVLAGGTIDNAVIGGSTAAAGTFTSLSASSATVGGSAVVTLAATQTLTNKTISGGTVTGAVVTGLSAPSGNSDAATKIYVDTADALKLNLSGGTMSGAIAMGTNKITGLGTPTQDADAATKAYVDGLAQGLDIKASVVVATTGNITLSGTQTIDGVALVAGQRVLVKDQTAPAENGVYLVAAGAWTRATDMDAWTELPGAFLFVEQGTVNDNTGWVCTVSAGGTLGSTAVTFEQFSGAGQITAGTGMTKSGNTLNVNTASSARIVVGADEIDLATTGVAASTYRSVTVDQWGRVTAGTNPTTLAGYGITDAYTTTYLDSALGAKLNLSGGTMSGAIAMGNNKVTGLGTPTANGDAVNLSYVTTLYGSTASAAVSAADALTYKNAAESAATTATTQAGTATSAASTATTQAGIATTQAGLATTAANNAEAAWDQFDDRYLGAKSSPPIVDNDGNPLVTGALYFDTTANLMRVYTGTAWMNAGSAVNGTSQRQTYTATAGQTSFAITYEIGFVDVYLNGLKLEAGVDFTATNGTSVVLTSGAVAGDYIDIVAYGAFSLANMVAKTGDTMSGPLIVNVNSTTDALRITQTGTGNALVVEDSTNPDATPFVVDASGNVIRGYTSAVTTNALTVPVQVHGNGVNPSVSGYSAFNWNDSAAGSGYTFFKSRGSVIGTPAIVASGDNFGRTSYFAYDGASWIEGARVQAEVDGTPGTNDMPGRLVFSTTAAGASTPTERMRIDSVGNVGIGVTPNAANKVSSGGTYPSSGNISRGYIANGTIPSTSTTQAVGYSTFLSTQAAAFTVTALQHYYATQGTIGATSAVTNQTAFWAESNLTGATNNYGFYGNIPSGTGRWNFFANGTANNAFAGNTSFGGTSAPTVAVDVTGTVRAQAAATQDAVALAGRAGGTGSFAVSLTPTTLTASRTLTLPDASTTVVGTDVTQTLTNKTLGTGTLFGAAINGQDNDLTRVDLKDTGWVYFNSGTTNALDFTNGSHQRWTPNTGAQTLSITNWPPSGNLGELLIEGVNLGAATITWPTINWIKSDGTTTTTFADNGVTLQASGTDWVFLWTRDAGTTIYGKVVR